MLIIIAIMVGMLFVQPFIGFVSDKIGRKPFIIAGSIGLLVLSIPAFMLITSGKIGLIFAGLLILAIVLNFFIGVMASTLPAMFPTHLRYSALASAFNVSVLIAGLTMKETANKPLRGAAPAASDMAEAKELLQEHHDNIEQKIEDIDAEIAELEAKRENLVQQHPRIN